MPIFFNDALWRRTYRFLASEDGPTSVEYAVMLAAIVVVCVASIQTVGTRTNDLFVQATAGW